MSLGQRNGKGAKTMNHQDIFCHACKKRPCVPSRDPDNWITHHLAKWCEVANPRRRELREQREARKKARTQDKQAVRNTQSAVIDTREGNKHKGSNK